MTSIDTAITKVLFNAIGKELRILKHYKCCNNDMESLFSYMITDDAILGDYETNIFNFFCDNDIYQVYYNGQKIEVNKQ